MPLNIVTRRFYDEHFFALANIIPQKYNTLYQMQGNLWNKNLLLIQDHVIFLSDYLKDDINHNHLSRLIDKIQGCTIISSVLHAHTDFPDVDAKWIWNGGDILFQMNQYPQLVLLDQKDTDADTHWCCLSLLPRLHRLMAGCVILGHGLDRFGFVQVDPGPHDNDSWHDYLHLEHSFSTEQAKVLTLGWNKLQQRRLHPMEKYNVPPNHNALNFDLNLKWIYQKSCIDIVNETTYFNNGVFVSEKYLNTVYGEVFPIIISNKGYLEALRLHGFDTFDDVVDHSYDKIDDPWQRMWHAIQDNLHLLGDREHAWSKWHECEQRFKNNLDLARYSLYDNNAKRFKKALADLP